MLTAWNPTPQVTDLTFKLVDDLALATLRESGSGIVIPTGTRAVGLGPLLELAWYGRKTWQASTRGLVGFEAMVAALKATHSRWVSPDSRLGFVRVRRAAEDTMNRGWVSFCLSAQHAFQTAGIGKRTAQQIIGAMCELEENIHLHSEAADTGLIAFASVADSFEFVVADRGIGVLASLAKRKDFADLRDHGIALQTALKDGNSRFGPDRGGVGFHDLFVGLANLSAQLRFRSGDYALSIDGASPRLEQAELVQLACLKGFFISVRCSGPSRRA